MTDRKKIESWLNSLVVLTEAFKKLASDPNINREYLKECLVGIGLLVVERLPEVSDLVISLRDDVARESRFRGIASTNLNNPE